VKVGMEVDKNFEQCTPLIFIPDLLQL